MTCGIIWPGMSSERQKGSEEVAVALALGKDAARRALDGLLSGDEERAREEAERAAKSKSRRNKLIAYAIVGVLVLVGIAGMVLRFWPWFLALGLLGLVGLYGWSRVRKRFAAKKQAADAGAALAARVEPVIRVETPTENDAEERAREARAREEANALEEREIEDELLAMKARLDK